MIGKTHHIIPPILTQNYIIPKENHWRSLFWRHIIASFVSPPPMDKTKSTTVGNLTILSVLFVTILTLFIWFPSISKPFFSLNDYNHCPSSSNYPIAINVPKDDLKTALEGASMANRTVIIAIVNKAYVEEGNPGTTMLDLFLDSFWLGENTSPLLDHLLLVAVDQTAYERCRFKRLNCYKLKTDGVDFGGEKVYMSNEFIKMMWSRTLFLLEVLKHGYNFVFTDTDVMWLRNPFTRLSTNTSEDLQISTDQFNRDPRSEKNLINTGFYYIRSNNKTISLFEMWYGKKENSTGKKEQDVLLHLIRNGAFRQLGLDVRFLDTLYFSGFCAKRKDFRAAATVHANCCRTISAKVADLTAVLNDWKTFRRSVNKNETLVAGNQTTRVMQWRVPVTCYNSWKVHNKSLV